MELPRQSLTPNTSRKTQSTIEPTLTNPVGHDGDDAEGGRDGETLEVVDLAGRVGWDEGAGCVEAGETGEAGGDEEGEDEGVEGGSETEGEGDEGRGDSEGDLTRTGQTRGEQEDQHEPSSYLLVPHQKSNKWKEAHKVRQTVHLLTQHASRPHPSRDLSIKRVKPESKHRVEETHVEVEFAIERVCKVASAREEAGETADAVHDRHHVC